MTQDSAIQEIETLVNDLIRETPEIFLVSIRIKPTNNIKIFLDADDGLSIEKCVKINRRLYRIIEEKAWYPDGNFSLEVSSPGIEEPLKLLRQYIKNTGRRIEVTLNDESKKEGKLLSVSDEIVVIEQTEGKGKKAVTLQTTIPFADIKQTKVLIVF